MQGLITVGGQGEAEVGWRPEDLFRGRESGGCTSVGLYRRRPLHAAASTDYDDGLYRRRQSPESCGWELEKQRHIVISIFIFLTNVSMVGEPK